MGADPPVMIRIGVRLLYLVSDVNYCIKKLPSVFLVAFLAGCQMDSVEPLPDIRVSQVNGEVSFAFSIEGTPWWSKHNQKPYKVLRLMIAEDKEGPLWEIVAQNSEPGVDHVTYGILPKGFNQLIPTDGGPAKLKNGQEYRVTAGFGRARFVYKVN